MQKSCFSYPVEFVEDVFGESPVLAETLKKVTGSDCPRVFIVADMNVVQRTEGIGTKIGRYVQTHGIGLAGSPVVISGGEKVKSDSLQSTFRIFASMLSSKIGRNDVVLALGGGAILDIAGYAASQILGGAKLVRLPTTPAAMADAAFAEYAAVDSATVKDALRVSSVPAAVLIDTTFADTVLDGVWRSGVGEAVRQAVAKDAPLMKKVVKLAPGYQARDPKALAELIKAVVASRQKRGGTSFGLWSASRLEAMSGYKLPHGYSVPLGVCIDLCYAAERGVLRAKDKDSVIGLMHSCGTLDGISHSLHLLQQADGLLEGLDLWAQATGHGRVEIPSAVGKTVEETPDRESYVRAFKVVGALHAGA